MREIINCLKVLQLERLLWWKCVSIGWILLFEISWKRFLWPKIFLFPRNFAWLLIIAFKLFSVFLFQELPERLMFKVCFLRNFVSLCRPVLYLACHVESKPPIRSLIVLIRAVQKLTKVCLAILSEFVFFGSFFQRIQELVCVRSPQVLRHLYAVWGQKFQSSAARDSNGIVFFLSRTSLWSTLVEIWFRRVLFFMSVLGTINLLDYVYLFEPQWQH